MTVDCSLYNNHLNGDGKILKFENCRIVEDGKFVHKNIWVRDGQFIDMQKVYFNEKLNADVIIDCKNHILAPGLIDVQINGGLGIDFCDHEKGPEHTRTLAKYLLSTGVTSYCPTLVTSSKDTYKKVLPRIEITRASCEGAAILGTHLEGPFINVQRKGAHEAKFIKSFENGYKDVIDTYGNLDNTRIITLAPELPNAGNAIEGIVKNHNICVSMGHSASDLIRGEAAVHFGARMITHLFNAMLPYHHRDPHLVGLLTSLRIPQPIYYGIIADGVHTDPSALRIAQRANEKGLVLVTDAISAFGLGEGQYKLGEIDIELKRNSRSNIMRATLVNSETLCGSVASLTQCISNFANAIGRSHLPLAIECATKHPADALSLPHLGRYMFGSDADLVLFEDNSEELSVLFTVTRGKLAYVREEFWNVDIREA